MEYGNDLANCWNCYQLQANPITSDILTERTHFIIFYSEAINSRLITPWKMTLQKLYTNDLFGFYKY